MQRRTSGALVTLLLAALLAACGGNQATPAPAAGSPPNAAPADPAALSGEIRVWSWNVAASSLKETVAGFNQKYPNVKVTVEDVGRLQVYEQLGTGLAAGGAGLPDVVTIESDRMDVFTDQSKFPNGFVDLTARASKYKADFDPSKWAQSEVDGKIYSIPWDSGPTGLWYRADYFQQAGVDPKAIETWDDLIAAGEKIKAATGKKLLPVDIVADDAGFRMMTSQLGVCCYFNSQGEINLTDPKSVMALTKLKEMADKELIANISGWDGVVGATKNGDVATVPFGVWYSGTIQAEAPDLSGKWDVMPLPAFEKGGNRAANLGGSTLAIPAASKNPDAAWAYVEYSLATAEGQNTMMEKFGIWPSFLPAYSSDFYNQPVAYFSNQPVWKVFADQVSKIPPAEYTVDYAKGQTVLATAQTKVLSQGADPKTALAEAAAELANQSGRKIAGQ